MTWTMIVFLYVYGAASQVAVPGFGSLRQCLDAAETYKQNLAAADPDKHVVYSASCVVVGGSRER